MEPALNLWAPDFHADDFPTVTWKVSNQRERENPRAVCVRGKYLMLGIQRKGKERKR